MVVLAALSHITRNAKWSVEHHRTGVLSDVRCADVKKDSITPCAETVPACDYCNTCAPFHTVCHSAVARYALLPHHRSDPWLSFYPRRRGMKLTSCAAARRAALGAGYLVVTYCSARAQISAPDDFLGALYFLITRLLAKCARAVCRHRPSSAHRLVSQFTFSSGVDNFWASR